MACSVILFTKFVSYKLFYATETNGEGFTCHKISADFHVIAITHENLIKMLSV